MLMETNKTLWILSIIWAYLVAWGLSALIHSADSEIGSLSGIATFSGLVSVSAVAASLLLPPILVCQFAYRYRGWRTLAIAILCLGAIMGAILTVGGSSAASVKGLAESFAGSTALIIAFLILGSAPQVIVPLLRHRVFRRHTA
jgi:hypothetical protein